MKKIVYYCGSILAISLFFSWAVFNEYCRINLPTSPDVTVDRIYAENFHVKIVYMSRTEKFLTYGMPLGGGLIIIGLVVMFGYANISRKPKRSL